MKPPICAICGLDFRGSIKEGALLSFRKDPIDPADQKLSRNREKIGHPKHLAWFCGEHMSQAEKFQDLKLEEALLEMRKLQKDSDKASKDKL